MAELKSSDQDLGKEIVNLNIDTENLDLESARTAARNKAREMNADAMMLSWHNESTGAYWPTYECGAGGERPWVLYAESRGSNLTVRINDGEYEFYFLLF
ncbi:MAG: AF1514 family protein [Desulfobacteraceae bacterium]|nr:AF1514 family protein [Desulfobacteraceae bacterium]